MSMNPQQPQQQPQYPPPPPYQASPPYPPQGAYPPPNPYGQPPTMGYYNVVCPRCGNPHSQKVGFTWWGGVLGPKLFSHVKCMGCGFAYNGKTGRPNTTAITIYLVISAIIGLAIGIALFTM